MTPEELLAFIELQPELVTKLGERDDIGIAEILNTPSVTVAKESFITKRTMFAKFGLTRGAEIMQSLRAVANSASEMAAAVGEMVSLLEDVDSGGLDVGHPDTETFIPKLVAGGILSNTEGAVVIALGQQLISPAMAEFGQLVTPVDVKRARRLWEAGTTTTTAEPTLTSTTAEV